MRVLRARWLWTGGAMIRDGALRVDSDGNLADVGPASSLIAPGETAHETFEDGLILPGAVNSHSHAWQILLRGRVDFPKDFRDWVDRGLYPYLVDLDDDRLEAGCLLAFSEMALSGVTSVGEFHYVHNGPAATDPLGAVERDALVIRAARRVGLRITLLRSFYDLGEKSGQDRFRETPTESVDRLDALDELFDDDPNVNLAAAPHSLHGASEGAIRTAFAWAEARDRPCHIHLAEQREDLEVSQTRYGTTPLRALERMGILTPRLVCVHGVWLDPDECRALGTAGAGLAYNPTSNLALGDGISALSEMAEAGVCISLGTDGACANNQVDLLAEVRRAEQLQRIRHLRMGVLPPLLKDSDIPSPAQRLLRLATANGARNLGTHAGSLAPGRAADFIVLDTKDLSLLPHDPKGDGEDLLANVVNALSVRSALHASFVAGRSIVRDGQLTSVHPVDFVGRLQSG